MDDNGMQLDNDTTLDPQAKQEKLNPDSPLRPIANAWIQKLHAAKRAKSMFDADAREAMQFFDGANVWSMSSSNQRPGLSLMSRPTPAPAFRISINRVFEAVKLIGAVLYARNPNRTVTPRRFPVVPPEMLGINPQSFQVDPMTGQPSPDPSVQMYVQTSQAIGLHEEKKKLQSQLLSSYLNYTPNELDLKTNCRRAIDEGIIKGAGVLWTEAVQVDNVPPAEPTLLVGSFMDSVDNLLLDPDAQVIQEIQWCAKRCVLPIDQVASMFDLSRDDLKPNLESYSSTTRQQEDTSNARGGGKQRTGKTNDLVTFWKVWSKCGFGDRLKGAKKEDRGMFDPLGDYCYVVVSEGVEFPLNVPPAVLKEQADQDGLPQSLRARASWPIPFWAANSQGWPFSMWAPNPKPNTLWPLSYIKPGIGELRFLQWAFSFLMQRLAISCETLVGVSKAADQDLKQQLLAPSENGFKVIEVSEALGKSVNEIISVFQQPGVSSDMWQIISAVSDLFDKRVGLTELVYGQTAKQMRSASEASAKQGNLQIRPDDLANSVEDWMGDVAAKEAMAARWLLQPKDVAPVLGPLGAEAWGMHMNTQDGDPTGSIAREFEYRIESGTARRPDKQAKIDSMQQAMQVLLPVLQQQATQGNADPLNQLLSDWCEANDIDPTGYLVQPPPPPPMPPPGAGPSAPPSEAPPGPAAGNPDQPPPGA